MMSCLSRISLDDSLVLNLSFSSQEIASDLNMVWKLTWQSDGQISLCSFVRGERLKSA